MDTILFENKFFYITKCEEFPYVPGLLAIYEKDVKWNCNEKIIKLLAEIEKIIRDELMEQGVALTGIYREEYEDDRFRILIIPYDVKILEQNNISPDLYQPYIREYLESFNNDNNDYNIKDDKIILKLKEINNE